MSVLERQTCQSLGRGPEGEWENNENSAERWWSGGAERRRHARCQVVLTPTTQVNPGRIMRLEGRPYSEYSKYNHCIRYVIRKLHQHLLIAMYIPRHWIACWPARGQRGWWKLQGLRDNWADLDSQMWQEAFMQDTHFTSATCFVGHVFVHVCAHNPV